MAEQASAGGGVLIRLTSYKDPNSKHGVFPFDPIERILSSTPLKLGRQVRAPATSSKPTFTAAGVLLNHKAMSGEHIWFKSKVVSRGHAEIWCHEGQVYLKDTASSSGTFLNGMRLSPSGRESRPYPVKEGDTVQMGIDFQGKPEDVYRAPNFKISLTPLHNSIVPKKTATYARFRATLRTLLSLTNPFSTSASVSAASGSNPDCCICLSGIGPYQALFLAPCSHCYHFKCIRSLVMDSGAMFQCPMCRQVANLEASVSMESLDSILQDEEGGLTDEDDEVSSDDTKAGVGRQETVVVKRAQNAQQHPHTLSVTEDEIHEHSGDWTSDPALDENTFRIESLKVVFKERVKKKRMEERELVDTDVQSMEGMS
ncbi:hypothetical protein HDU85_002579 [Gaertneriomyces sp. JEL0708]|nr:hypothetical protein HDU85_002579 [Gaertneriomyces sp. JEL0708]